MFEILSTSAKIGTVWPGTNPVYGNDTTHVSGPDLQKQQQKYFSKCIFIGFYKILVIIFNISLVNYFTVKDGLTFKSRGEITVKAALIS